MCTVIWIHSSVGLGFRANNAHVSSGPVRQHLEQVCIVCKVAFVAC
jgi:hypothetical protein